MNAIALREQRSYRDRRTYLDRGGMRRPMSVEAARILLNRPTRVPDFPMISNV